MDKEQRTLSRTEIARGVLIFFETYGVSVSREPKRLHRINNFGNLHTL